MKFIPQILTLTFLFLLLAEATSAQISINAARMNAGQMVGELDKEQILNHDEQVKKNMAAYSPDEKAVAFIRKVEDEYDVVVFLGVWNSESVNHVPSFMRVMEDAGNPNFSVTWYGVNRAKRAPGNIVRRHNIQDVPTFIFYKDGEEAGRIVESPDKSIEEDIMKILAGGS